MKGPAMSTASTAGRNRVQVQTAGDVRRLLAAEIESLVANPDLDPIAKARVLAHVTRVALRAMEQETLEARIEAIESALNIRRGAHTKETT